MTEKKENVLHFSNGEMRQLKDELIYQKTLAKAFVHYVCELSRGGEISEIELAEIETTYLNATYNFENQNRLQN